MGIEMIKILWRERTVLDEEHFDIAVPSTVQLILDRGSKSKTNIAVMTELIFI